MKNKKFDHNRSDLLRERFGALWTRCLLPTQKIDGNRIYDDLIGHYSEPGRWYHTRAHVFHCLSEFDRAITRLECPDAVELALWFHDAIFVPGADNNEQRSAGLLTECAGTSFSPSFVNKTCGLILVTTHKQPPAQGDESYMVDIDLSSFGVNWIRFVRDSLHVRYERSDVADKDYYLSHARFLRSLLDRPHIFQTELFHDLYEESARRNIRQLLGTKRYPQGTPENEYRTAL
ncbi:MAG: HD domain-containing protein [Gammaproteobacteria bacterium]